LNAADIIIKILVLHILSPKVAQKKFFIFMLDQNMILIGLPSKILILKVQMKYVTKMVPTTDKSKIFEFGGEYAGTLVTGLEAEYKDLNLFLIKKKLHEKLIKRTDLMMGRTAK
jgi:elongation factor 2